MRRRAVVGLLAGAALGAGLLAGGVLGSPFAAAQTITSVSPIYPTGNQTITITGSDFGLKQPYNGDSPYIEIIDVTKNWAAGYCDPALNPSTLVNHCVPVLSPSDAVGLNMTYWVNNEIQIKGFTYEYGSGNWSLSVGDQITIRIWNPQTLDDSNEYHTVVVGVPPSPPPPASTTTTTTTTPPPPTTTPSCGGIPGPCYCITGPGGGCGPTTPTKTTTGPASKPGKACIFNNPTGVTGVSFKIPIPYTKQQVAVFGGIGHVAWAFLANPDSGQWQYGSNDGPKDHNIFGGTSQTWKLNGKWSSVLKKFASREGHYETYRCISVLSYHTSAADKMAKQQQHKPYWIFDWWQQPWSLSVFGRQIVSRKLLEWHQPINDCLSNTVDVLRAYGVDLSSDQPAPDSLFTVNTTEWLKADPNNYYWHQLPSGFLQMQRPV